MAKRKRSLEELVREPPPEARGEAKDFVEFLLEKKPEPRKKGKFALSWAGILSEYKDQFTAMELQKKALEWRMDGEHE